MIILATKKFNQNQQLIYKIMLKNQKLFNATIESNLFNATIESNLFNATIESNLFMITQKNSVENFVDYNSVILTYKDNAYNLIVQDYFKKYFKLYQLIMKDYFKELTVEKIDAEFDKMLINFDKSLFDKKTDVVNGKETVITYTRK